MSFSCPVFAQEQDPLESLDNLDSVDSIEAEAPPRPEPPYPGSEDIDAVTPPPKKVVAEPARPEVTGGNWSQKLPSIPMPAPAPGVSRPVKVDESGNYFYGTDIKDTTVPKPGVARPLEQTASGEYHYDPLDKSTERKSTNRPNVERPLEMAAKGDFYYKLDEKKPTRTASFRVGVMSPPTIKNKTTSFASAYGSQYQPVLLGDYEWRLTSKIGKLGAKFTSGIFLANGRGSFVTPRPEGTQPLERLNFFMFPNQATLIYKFQYSDKQILVPYVEGGGAYYTMAEIRDDTKPPKFAGGAGLVGAGGLNVLLDWADRRGVQRLNAEYGIAHVWLTVEGRITVGAVSEVDVSSQAYTAGILFDF